MTEPPVLGDALSSETTLVPRYPQNSSMAARGLNPSSPMRPSPLRESSIAASMEDTKLRETPDAMLVDNDKNTHIIDTAANDITPPDSVKAEPLVIVDGSGARADAPSYTPTSNFHVEQRGIEDPFVSPAPQNSFAAGIYPNISVSKGKEFSPRPDRLGQQITGSNAQGILPSEAVVFVANLSNLRSDDQLFISCQNAFNMFGTCYVNIKRDKKNQPYAFVQFVEIADAELAVKEASGLKIDGRACRTERAKVDRSVGLSHKSGHQVTEQEARAIMEPFGAIAELAQLTIRDHQELGMPEGAIWVKFAFFQDFKDAVWNFDDSEGYALYIPPSDSKPELLLSNISPVSGYHVHSESDAGSIFLGSLPKEVSEDQLRFVLTPYGTINKITIIRKEGPRGGLNVFAFVQFQTPDEASAASQADITINSRKIRVERKEYSARRKAKMMAMIRPSPYQQRMSNTAIPNMASTRTSPFQQRMHHPTVPNMAMTPISPYQQRMPNPAAPNMTVLQNIHEYALSLGLLPQHASAILRIGQGYLAPSPGQPYPYQMGYQGTHMM